VQWRAQSGAELREKPIFSSSNLPLAEEEEVFFFFFHILEAF